MLFPGALKLTPVMFRKAELHSTGGLAKEQVLHQPVGVEPQPGVEQVRHSVTLVEPPVHC